MAVPREPPLFYVIGISGTMFCPGLGEVMSVVFFCLGVLDSFTSNLKMEGLNDEKIVQSDRSMQLAAMMLMGTVARASAADPSPSSTWRLAQNRL
jgi:hypothetical protein